MALDKELLEMDSLGIFPTSGENPDHYLKRGFAYVNHLHVGDKMDSFAVQRSLRAGDKIIGKVNESVKYEAVQKIKKRFKCDLSWLHAYYFEYQNGVRGTCYSPSLIRKNGQDLYVPPFISVVIDDYLLHEMVHTARWSLRDCIEYNLTEYYEERIAKSFNRFYTGLLMNARASIKFIFIRQKLRLAFGDMADYVLIRTSHDEAQDFYIEGAISKNPRENICKRAEKGILKCKIMKEKLKL